MLGAQYIARGLSRVRHVGGCLRAPPPPRHGVSFTTPVSRRAMAWPPSPIPLCFMGEDNPAPPLSSLAKRGRGTARGGVEGGAAPASGARAGSAQADLADAEKARRC